MTPPKAVKTQESPVAGSVWLWQWNAKTLMFVALFFPLTLSLGVWQLQRADQKQEILAEHHLRRTTEPVALSTINLNEDHQYRRVSAHGEPDGQRYFLLDNRTRRGRAGYEVLWPLKVKGMWVLVNRGWVDGGLDRQILPKVSSLESVLEGGASLEGYLYRADKAIVLGEQEVIRGWPQVVQQVDMAMLSERLGLSARQGLSEGAGEALFPYVLRLEGLSGQGAGELNSKNGLQLGWIVVNILPAKHTGYAVQWFAMALALLILSVASNSNLGEWLAYRLKPGDNTRRD